MPATAALGSGQAGGGWPNAGPGREVATSAAVEKGGKPWGTGSRPGVRKEPALLPCCSCCCSPVAPVATTFVPSVAEPVRWRQKPQVCGCAEKAARRKTSGLRAVATAPRAAPTPAPAIATSPDHPEAMEERFES